MQTEKLVAIAVFVLLLAGGCAGPKQSTESVEQRGEGGNLEKYEADFRPSDYDPDPATAAGDRRTRAKSSASTSADTVTVLPQEQVQGYRVQVFSSTDIDAARTKLAEAEEMVPGEWFYLDFDPPVYKIRAGNFVTKFEADRFARSMIEKGFPGSWSVPTRVFKNPPPPPVRTPAPPPPK